MNKRIIVIVSIILLVIIFFVVYIYVRYAQVKVMNMKGILEPLSTYQLRRGLNGTQIGKFFTLKESVFASNLFRYKNLVVSEPLMLVLDEYRKLKGSGVTLTSYNRSEQDQKELNTNNPTSAKFSPHVKFMAADVDTSGLDPRKEAERMIQAGKNVGIPIRVGVNSYIKEGIKIIHVDVTPYYYGGLTPIIKDSTIPEAFKKTGILW